MQQLEKKLYSEETAKQKNHYYALDFNGTIKLSTSAALAISPIFHSKLMKYSRGKIVPTVFRSIFSGAFELEEDELEDLRRFCSKFRLYGQTLKLRNLDSRTAGEISDLLRETSIFLLHPAISGEELSARFYLPVHGNKLNFSFNNSIIKAIWKVEDNNPLTGNFEVHNGQLLPVFEDQPIHTSKFDFF